MSESLRLTYGMNVLNGERFLTAQLKSIYDFADEIVIVEGAYSKFSSIAPNATSTDETLNLIRSFPDPENKIALLNGTEFYADRKEMCTEIIRNMTGDVLVQIDVDEFFHKKTHEFIRKSFESNPYLDEMRFNFNDYFFSPNIRVSCINAKGLGNVKRAFRVRSATHFSCQRPPILADKDGDIVPREVLQGSKIEQQGHIMHHATAVDMSQISEKMEYYNQMWGLNNKGSDQLSFKNIDLLNVHGIPRYFTPLEWGNFETPNSMLPVFSERDLELRHLENLIKEPRYQAFANLARKTAELSFSVSVVSVAKLCWKIVRHTGKRRSQFLKVLVFSLLRKFRHKNKP